MNSALREKKRRLREFLAWSLLLLNLSALKKSASVLGYRSAIFLRLAEWTSRLYRVFGFTYRPGIYEVHILGYPNPVYVRPGTGDGLVLEQIFINDEYLPVAHLDQPEQMIDCGGNIGCSSIYFLNRYPDLKVIIVEPDSDNIALCRRNLSPYAERVQIIQAAVWSRATDVVLSGTDWAAKVRQAKAEENSLVPATDMVSLLNLTSRPFVDLLKIDIEWSEIEIFRNASAEWLSRVGNIAIELHDAECKEVFFRALAPYQYTVSQRGELTFCQNIRSSQLV